MIIYNEGTLRARDSVELFYRAWVPDRAKGVIVGVHGFAEHSGLYKDVGEYLAGKGYAFFMHDLRGHGMTGKLSGMPGYIDYFDQYINDLREFISYVIKNLSVNDVVLLGHSMGGLAVLHYLARVKEGVKKAITSGAATMIYGRLRERVTSPFQLLLFTLSSRLYPKGMLTIPIKQGPPLFHDEEKFRQFLQDPLVLKRCSYRLYYELFKAAREVWRYIDNVTTPLLLIHGGADQLVPPKASIEVYNRLKRLNRPVELRIYEGLYHEVLLEPSWRSVLDDIINWIER